MLAWLRLYEIEFLKVGQIHPDNVVWSQIIPACIHLGWKSGPGACKCSTIPRQTASVHNRRSNKRRQRKDGLCCVPWNVTSLPVANSVNSCQWICLWCNRSIRWKLNLFQWSLDIIWSKRLIHISRWEVPPLFVYWDKDGGPVKWSCQAITLDWLNCMVRAPTCLIAVCLNLLYSVRFPQVSNGKSSKIN